MAETFHLTLIFILALIPVANPLTSITLLLALGSGLDPAERDRQILKSACYVFIIMIVCFYAGQFIMTVFGISLPGLRIAGGLIVAYLGSTMLFPHTQADEAQAQKAMLSEEEKRKPQIRDLSFVPLALPGTAGPGTIAVIISGAASVHHQHGIPLNLQIAVWLSALFIVILFWVSLRSANTIMHWLGAAGIDAISRLVGFLLIGMGVQFVINGVEEVIQAYVH